MYRAQEFVSMAGVTLPALHHYDRLGLLRLVRHEANGYLLYSENNLGRLEQILVLKFLGLPLKQDKDRLRKDSVLPSVLRREHAGLVEKRRRLNKAIDAIGAALKSMESSSSPDWQLFRIIIGEIEIQHDMDWTTKYYSEEAKAKVEL